MKLRNIPASVADWSRMPAVRISGESGSANARGLQVGDVQLRLVEYAGYMADHWCSKGHIVYVVAGELVIEHQNNQQAHALSAGMSWLVADDEGPPHRLRSESAATIFVLD